MLHCDKQLQPIILVFHINILYKLIHKTSILLHFAKIKTILVNAIAIHISKIKPYPQSKDIRPSLKAHQMKHGHRRPID